MGEQELRDRIVVLEAEVARLSGDRRLGPRPETQEDVDRRTNALIDAVREAKEVPPVDRSKVCTTSGEPPEKVRAEQTEDVGQHKAYIVLCADERRKGFVRPYRDTYRHVGPAICGKPLLDTSAANMVCFMDPKHEGACGVAGGLRPQACGATTIMGHALSETYARDPKFYGATFCCYCNRHFPVNEFVWLDGERVGS